MKRLIFLLGVGLLVFSALTFGSPKNVAASHSWGPPYHWARSSNPFSLALGDNVSTVWDSYLVEASNDWSQSSVLDTTVVPGSTRPKSCKPTAGGIEVCNSKYGNNGWLGIAQIWITSGDHITQAITKLNDTYFNNPPYNSPAWRRLVTCQEIGHGFGLDHQDETFNNPNLGSCMDYTSDPDGPPSNEHPNTHDYDQLETIYNSHFDGTLNAVLTGRDLAGEILGTLSGDTSDLESQANWGLQIKDNGGVGVYERDFGFGRKILTFVIWAK